MTDNFKTMTNTQEALTFTQSTRTEKRVCPYRTRLIALFLRWEMGLFGNRTPFILAFVHLVKIIYTNITDTVYGKNISFYTQIPEPLYPF